MDNKEDRHCFSCGKTFSKPYYYERHKQRKTPCLIQDVPENDDAKNRCKFCNKTYKYKYTLTRHYKTCKIKNGGMKILAEKIQREQAMEQKKQLDNITVQMGQLLSLVKTQSEEIQKLKQNQFISTNNAMHNFGDNNTQNINQSKHITINNYMTPDISGLKLTDDRINQYDKLSCAVLDTIYFNPDRPENHSIYLVNKKDKTLMVYTGKPTEECKWKLLTSDGDRKRLATQLQNIIVKEGVELVNSIYESKEETFLKLPKYLSNRIISFNSYEDEVRIYETDMLNLALKHKAMVASTKKNKVI